ncbi:MAG: hypothetical protein ABWX84_13590 [Nocardioides sp.]
MKTTSRKILVPLATLLAAGAVAVGSGADFTSTTNSATAVTAGKLIHTNSANGVTLNITKIKPGDSISSDVVITNTGDLDSTLTLAETSEYNGATTPTVKPAFTAGDLKLTITKGATVVYDGNLGAWANNTPFALGALNVGGSTTLTFTVSMPSTAGNANQGAVAGATYQWVSTQVAGSSSIVPWA